MQFNPTVGDLAGNAQAISAWTEKAREVGADLVVFPELALCGYPPKDLLHQRGFINACASAAKQVGESASKGLTLVFGCPLPAEPSAPGADPMQPDGVCNSLLVYRDGEYLEYYDKRLLPSYDVFDEDRHFVSGDRAVVVSVRCADGGTTAVGLSICEDHWKGRDAGFAARYADRPDPVAELAAAGARVIVSPSASPFVLGKGERHRRILAHHAQTHGVFIAAVNQVGGNDDLVFDGHAAVFDPSGTLVAAGPGFVESMTVVDVPGVSDSVRAVTDPVLTTAPEALLHRALVRGVRDYLRKTGFTSAIVGLSGGIDSAVTAVIAAAAMGRTAVMGVAMPSRFSSEGSLSDARELARRLGIAFEEIPIEPPVRALESSLAPIFQRLGKSERDITEENLQSRVRGTLLMGLSNKLGSLVLTTGNKSELAVGYCTLYGDMNGGLAVLSDVSKQWVYRLARWMNEHPDQIDLMDDGLPVAALALRKPPIPVESISKPPSAELRPDQTDQDSLPPYDMLDRIIEGYVEARLDSDEIARRASLDPHLVRRIVTMIDRSEYKRRQAAVGLKVTATAFGVGRRFPIAQRYRP